MTKLDYEPKPTQRNPWVIAVIDAAIILGWVAVWIALATLAWAWFFV